MRTFFQFLEQDIDMGSIAGYPIDALRIEAFLLDKPDTLLEEERDQSSFSLDDVFQRGSGFHFFLVLLGISLLLLLPLALLPLLFFQAPLLQLLVLFGFGFVPPSLG